MNSITERYIENLAKMENDKLKLRHAAGEHGITLTQSLLLFLVKNHGGELVYKQFSYIPGNTPRNVESLAQKGLIGKHHHGGNDRRRTVLYITKKGEALIEKLDTMLIP